jgi:hypothetical protein
MIPKEPLEKNVDLASIAAMLEEIEDSDQCLDGYLDRIRSMRVKFRILVRALL